MEMTNFNGENIVNDALLAYVLEFYCISRCPWVRYECHYVDRGTLLKLLMALRSVLTKTWENVAYTMQLASLWLVSYYVELVARR